MIPRSSNDKHRVGTKALAYGDDKRGKNRIDH